MAKGGAASAAHTVSRNGHILSIVPQRGRHPTDGLSQGRVRGAHHATLLEPSGRLDAKLDRCLEVLSRGDRVERPPRPDVRLIADKLSERDRRTIVDAYRAGGVSLAALAEQFGVSDYSIRKVLRRAGLKPKRSSLSEDLQSEIRGLRAEGVSVLKIVTATGIPRPPCDSSSRRCHRSGPGATSVREDSCVASIQTSDEIQEVLTRLRGQEISALQVLGINSLKSMSPMPEALAGEVVESTSIKDRIVTLETPAHQVVIDLQRTGNLVRLTDAQPYAMAAGSSRPTVRLVLEGGQGLDLTEPAKTKRITVTLSARP